MIESITKDRWREAQEAERKQHKKTMEEGLRHYKFAYKNNFRYLDINPDAKQSNIVEVGCADFPALRYCLRGPGCVIIEPMPSVPLKTFCEVSRVALLPILFEEVLTVSEKEIWQDSELWIFNVMQHVQDPERFIEVAKIFKTVKYFEPIDTEIEDYHPHRFTKEDFDRWFPGVNKFYNETTNICFHDGPCCYGVWEKS